MSGPRITNHYPRFRTPVERLWLTVLSQKKAEPYGK